MEESLRSILEMYKDDIITIDETLDLINAMDNGSRNVKAGILADTKTGLPWDDDQKMRIVAYIGKRLIKKGESSAEFCVELEGSPLNVECWGSLTCEDICGNAVAGNYIQCGDINGSATAGSHIECGDIGNNAAAGGHVNSGDIGGNLSAGGNVECGDVGGDVHCNSLNCGDIEGSRIE